MNEFIIWSEFPKYIDDREECGEQDFGGDPWGYSVTLNGAKIATFGDDYHDKGQAKAEGFIKGYALAANFKHPFKIKYKSKVQSGTND